MPFWKRKILGRLLRKSIRNGAMEELSDRYDHIARTRSKRAAERWITLQILAMIPSRLRDILTWRSIMVHADWKVAFRRLRRHKTFTFINIIGLATGLACCLAILNFIGWETGYDRFHAHSSRIHRLCLDAQFAGQNILAPHSSPPAGPAMLEFFPEIENYARIMPPPMDNPSITVANQTFEGNRLFFADSTLFDVFSFSLARGDVNTALSAPFSVVLTRTSARRFFGNQDPMGQTIRYADQLNLTVTGVMEDVPAQSHFTFDMLGSYSTRQAIYGDRANQWIPFTIYTYLLMKEGADIPAVEARIAPFVRQHLGPILDRVGGRATFFLQPLVDIHLKSHMSGELSRNGDIGYIYIFSAVALFVMSIAVINFINLSTARALTRLKEVGIRKTVGASRPKLVAQFLAESGLHTFAAFLLSLILLQIGSPLFQSLGGVPTGLRISWELGQIPLFIGLATGISILAGLYPALLISRFMPLDAFRGRQMRGRVARGDGGVLRNIMVVLQFAVSILLLAGTSIVVEQLRYTRNKKLGFDRENVVIIPYNGVDLTDALKNRLRLIPGIRHVASANRLPGHDYFKQPMAPQGIPAETPMLMYDLTVDPDYFAAMGIELEQGRLFSTEFPRDEHESILINQAAARELGWDDPVGKTIREVSGRAEEEWRVKRVIGVIKDYHFMSLRQIIDPLYIECDFHRPDHIILRLAPGDQTKTLAKLKSVWQEVAPDKPLEFHYLDDALQALYRSEERLQKVLMLFAGLAIFISCMGLLGMTAYLVERKTKEIGIRKVMGASSARVVVMLSGQLTRWVAAANLLAWPVTWLVMSRWMRSFAYQSGIGVSHFLLPGLTAFLIALLTITIHTWRAARANPITALKYE